MIATQYIAGVMDCLAPDPAQAELTKLQGRLLEAERRLIAETAIELPQLVDPRDATYDPETGTYWRNIGSGAETSSARIRNEQDLAFARAKCRDLAETNPYAINGHENRINYIVGTGHSYSASAKKGREVSGDAIEAVQQAVDAFVDANHWQQRQQEIIRRKDRDGECFLRLFKRADGILAVRFVEPSQVSQPAGNQTDTWGIIADPDDVETVLGYWIDGEQVDAAEIQHRKRGVDFNVKRGQPLFDATSQHLRGAERLLKCMNAVAEIQASIAFIRKYSNTSSATVAAQIVSNADAQVTNTQSGKTTYFRRFDPGTILDASANVDYEFPAHAIEADKFAVVLQARLRAVASMLVMPEFMLTSDASNANYSSTMVAEGPAVKHFERLQWDMIGDDLAIIDAALQWAVESGRLTGVVLDDIEVVASPPRLITRDRATETNADVALVDAKIMSKHTAAIRQDLDPDAEQARIAEEAEVSAARIDRMMGYSDRGAFGGADDGDRNGQTNQGAES